MISEQSILSILEQEKEFEKFFFVSVKVSGDNKITITADTDEGITIDQCGEISSKLEEMLDRDQEDFELEVTSPGLTEPLKVPRQYTKNIGKCVDIVLADGKKIDGELLSANDDGITIKQTITEKVNGKRTKSEVTNTINFAAIKTTKLKIKF
ncbi:MAG: ribosome assembly cofactor RimP [Bacteroidales bacterium]|nr:ribosome assembly cofactor RimP [Bacteroidales bacterium]